MEVFYNKIGRVIFDIKITKINILTENQIKKKYGKKILKMYKKHQHYVVLDKDHRLILRTNSGSYYYNNLITEDDFDEMKLLISRAKKALDSIIIKKRKII